MMKFVVVLFVFLSSLIPTKIANESEENLHTEAFAKKEEFENNAFNAYDYYDIIKDECVNGYVYEIIIGKYKKDLYYDIFLYNETSNYVPRIEINGIENSIPALDDEGNIYFSTSFLTNPKNSTIIVYLFDGISKQSIVSIPTDYSGHMSNFGNSKGVIVSYPEPIEVPDKSLVLILSISICVIFIALTGIGIFYIIKVGKKKAIPMGYQKNLPHVDKDSVEVLYRQFNPNNYEDIKIDVSVGDSLEETDIKADEVSEVIRDEETSVYDKSPKYSDEVTNEEKINEVNIESLLMMKGYKTDYSQMTESERNDVMVYLMVLRKTGQISYDQYSKEVIKLWKK